MKEFITRKIKREYNKILLDWAEVWTNWDFKVPATNAEKANDYLVKVMTGKTQEEIDNMSEKEFEKTLNKINSLNWPSSESKWD